MDRVETTYEFGEFRFTPEENLLKRGSEPISLPPKTLGVLRVLIENAGRAVSKDELMQAVWEGTVVEESALAKNVWHLRQALGDDPKGHRFIQTVPKIGYRFVARVNPRWFSGAFTQESLALKMEPTAVSIAATPATAVGVEGNATAEVEVKRRPSTLLWVVAAVLTVAALVIVLIVLLGSRSQGLKAADAERGTRNDDAYRNYLQSIYEFQKRTPEGAERAIQFIDKAIELDPEYALAWAGKARIHRYAAYIQPGSDVHHEYQLSAAAVKKALSIDPNLSEAWAASCEIRFFYEYNFAAAETECAKAVELKPNSPLAHETLSRFLTSRGRHDEAVEHSRRAVDLEPSSLLYQRSLGVALYYSRKFSEAENQFRRVLEMSSGFEATRRWLFSALQLQGKRLEAVDVLASQGGGQSSAVMRDLFATKGWEVVLEEQAKRTDKGSFYAACQYAQLGRADDVFASLEKALERREWGMAFLKVEPLLDPVRNDPRLNDLIQRVETR